ncbi:MAG: hypothetical protein JST85_17535 [Acidobacteria bacterium]|nr:hypothetical protein [Acidobacteriota bacterium]
MKKIAAMVLCVLALVIAAEAQKKTKPWTEWSEKEVSKMLNDSPWGQTQTSTDTSQMTYSPTPRNLPNRPLDSPDSSSQGALNQSVNLNFRIRFLSAKPIRQAFARRVMMNNPQLTEQLKQFADQTSDQYIVVAVDYDSNDRRFSGPAMQAFNSANPGQLKTNTYLEIKDGKRVFLNQYMQPTNDGMGAKFVFPRMVEGKPFITAESGYIRFYSELSPNIKLNMRFKIADMNYNEKLEF